MALPVKDGNGSLTNLKTTLTGSDHMPHHIIQEISGSSVTTIISKLTDISSSAAAVQTVTASTTNPVAVRLQTNALSLGSGLPVTASSTYPVYVTGAVTVSQPVNVDLVVGDTITASIANTGFAQAIEAVTQSYNSADGYGKFNVKLTGSSTVTIDNTAATNAFMALSGANLNDKLAVQLTGSSVVRAGNYDALLVRTTGSEVLVTNPGISAMIDSITGSSNGTNPLSVKVTGSNVVRVGNYDAIFVKTTASSVTIDNSNADAAFSNLVSAYTTAGTASFLVQITGSNAYPLPNNYNAVLVKTTGSSNVTIDNTNFGNAINNISSASHTFNDELALKVKVTGSSAVTIDNTNANAAFGNLASAYTTAGTASFLVQITGSNVYSLPNGYNAVFVKTTGSSNVTIDNPSFQQLINNTTESFYALPSGKQSVMVKITGSNDGEPVYIRGTASIGASTYGYPEGSALVVKITASTQDTYSTQLSNISTYSYSGGTALITKLTGSGTNENDRLWITGSVSSNASVTVSDGLKVELSGTNVKQISNSSSNTYLQTSIAPVATGSTLKVFAPPNWGGSVPSGDPNVIIFDWNSPESGSVCAASASVNRKSLTVFNSSPHNVYFLIGLPWGDGTTNGFSLYQTNEPPNMYSFILYPSGSYFAEPHNVGMRHAIYLVSSSVQNSTRIMVTETY